MAPFLFFLCLFALVPTAFPRDLNYIESHFFRLSGQERSESWVLPFYRLNPGDSTNVRFHAMGSTNPKVPGLVEDIDSKNRDRLQSTLDQNYGRPMDASARVQARGRYKNFSQSFAANAGVAAVANDPVFPELKGIFFQDYTFISSYRFIFQRRLLVVPRLNYGTRRVMDTALKATDLVEKKPDTKLKNRPWKYFAEAGLTSQIAVYYFDVIFEANSLPLSNNPYAYWDTNLGIKSHDLARLLFPSWGLRRVDAYAMYSPIYGGHYDVSRTFKMGMGIEFTENLYLDLFTQDKFLFGMMAKANFKYFFLDFFTFERAYDDFHFQKSRQYGVSLGAQL